MIHLRALEVFLAVVDHGSFAAAGDAIGLTQSAVSLQIKSLEQDFDTALFDRSKRPPVLNADGLLLAQKARNIVSDFSSLRQSFKQQAYSGDFKLGVVPSVMTGLLPCCLAKLQAQQPGLLIHLESGLSRELATRVRKAELDAAIITEPQQTRDELQWKPFAAEPLVVISPPGSEGLQDHELLTRFAFLQFKPFSLIGDLIERQLRERQIRVRPGMVVDSLDAISLLVREGLGVSIVPLRKHCRSWHDKLVITAFGTRPIKRSIGLIERQHNPQAVLVETLHKILQQQSREVHFDV